MSGWAWLEQFLDPGQSSPGGGYWFWSGIGSGSPIFVALFVFLKHHNCHVSGCWRVGHIDPETHHPACKKHHSFAAKLGEAPSNDV